jgi:hypothetical protein
MTISRRRACPHPTWPGREKGGHRWFPRSLRTDRRGRRPAVIPAASPQLRRRPSPWPPRPALSAGHRVSSPHSRPPCTAPRPRSARFRAGSSLTGRQHWFLSVHLLVSLAGPAPSGSTGTSRRCQGCFPPSPASPGSGCPQLHPAAATTRSRRSFTPARLQAPRGAHASLPSRSRSTQSHVLPSSSCFPRSRAHAGHAAS